MKLLNSLQKGMVTGSEFMYANAPDNIRQLLKKSIDKNVADESTVFGKIIEWFLTDTEQILKLAKVTKKYNKDAAGYFAKHKEEDV